MSTVDDDRVSGFDLYRLGCATLVASWAAYARGAVVASVQCLPGVAAAVFPYGTERTVYNNALLDRGLGAGERAVALDVVAAAYAAVGIGRFAVWAHETDDSMCTDLERRGYALDTTTRAMGMALGHLPPDRSGVEVTPVGWPEYLAAEGLPPDFLALADHAALHPLAVRLDGEIVAASLAYDCGTDCGIYNVSTREPFRRRGLGTAVTLAQLYAARERGCHTASLQATAMAEGMYAALGFRNLGRFLEYVPVGRQP
jgi:hypothetical protein